MVCDGVKAAQASAGLRIITPGNRHIKNGKSGKKYQISNKIL
jgi:hypothetical protein